MLVLISRCFVYSAKFSCVRFSLKCPLTLCFQMFSARELRQNTVLTHRRRDIHVLVFFASWPSWHHLTECEASIRYINTKKDRNYQQIKHSKIKRKLMWSTHENIFLWHRSFHKLSAPHSLSVQSHFMDAITVDNSLICLAIFALSHSTRAKSSV